MAGEGRPDGLPKSASCEEFTEALKKITVPVLVMPGEYGQVLTPGLLAFIRS